MFTVRLLLACGVVSLLQPPPGRILHEMVDGYVRSVRQSPAEWITVSADVVAAHFRRTQRFMSVVAPAATPRQ